MASLFEIEEKTKELFAILDIDIGNIQKNLLRLNDLREHVIRRNDASLQKMLESIQAEANGVRENEQKRHKVRQELAQMLGVEKLTLTILEKKLTGGLRKEVSEKKIKIKALSQQLKLEYLSTARLLADCARFNGMLLKSILEMSQAKVITYNPNGVAERQSTSAFMNLQF